jgi:centromere protein J
VKYLYTSGAEECVFSDGTVERISVDGERIVEFPNGQRETHTKLFKVRSETVKIMNL